MLIARAGIGAKGGICESTFEEPGVASPEEARARVRKLVDDGADLIKICTGGGVIGRPADAAATEMQPEVRSSRKHTAADAKLPHTRRIPRPSRRRQTRESTRSSTAI